MENNLELINILKHLEGREMKIYKELEYDSKKEWHGIRNKHIGGSDCSIIMGYNQYKTPVDLWREKTGKVKPQDLSDNEAIKRGVKSENLLIEHFEINNPNYNVSKLEKTLISLKYPFMCANLDGVLENSNGSYGVLEIKTTTCFTPNQYYDVWIQKDENNKYTKNDIPLHYWLQIQHYLAVTGWEYAILYADIKLDFQGGKHILQKYICTRNDEAIKEIIEKEIEFNNYVINDIEPPYTKKIII